MSFEDIDGKLLNLYYSAEDKYYDFIDKVNEKFEIYPVIDKIDEYVPSFILLLLLLFLFLFGSFFLILNFAGIFGSSSASFVVVDSDSSPVPDVSVVLSSGDRREEIVADEFGEFKTTFLGSAIDVRVRKSGFEDYDNSFDIESGKEYEIVLVEETSDITNKVILFELIDGRRNPVPSNTDVSVTFSCSGSSVAPSPISKKGSSHSISVQSNCGVLRANFSATGYETKSVSVNVVSQTGSVVVVLNQAQLLGRVRVSVNDADSGDPVEGVSLRFKENGRTVFQGGSTDATGVKLVPNVPAGTYSVEAIPSEGQYPIETSSTFSISAEDISNNIIPEVRIELRKLVNGKKILLKFVDSQGNVEGAEATLVINGSTSVVKVSQSNGLVEYPNIDDSKNYEVIVSHAEYVLEVVENPNVIDSFSSQAQEITLRRASESNSGSARVFVSDFSQSPISGASVFLYSEDYSFPLLFGDTGESGLIDFNNLFPGDYNAHAEKTINGVKNEADSGLRAVDEGEVTEFNLVLFTANAGLKARVKDTEGNNVRDANVHFFDSVSGRKIGSLMTGNNGETPEFDIRVSMKPYVVVEKEGFVRFISTAYELFPNSRTVIDVALTHEDDFPDPIPGENEVFDIRLVDVLGSDRRQASRINDDSSYFFKFQVLVDGSLEDAETVFRAGLESDLNADSSNFVIKNFSYFNNTGILSYCFDDSDDFNSCNPELVTDYAKQANVDLGDINSGIYEVEVEVFVKDVAEEIEATELVRFWYGGKARLDSGVVFRQEQGVLYLWESFLDSSFCLNDCGIDIALTLSSQGGTDYPNGVNLNRNQLYELRTGQDYVVDYEVVNNSDESLGSVDMNISSDSDSVIAVPEFVAFSNFSPGSRHNGSFNLSTPQPTDASRLDVNLNLGLLGDSFPVLFSVSSKRTMVVNLEPDRIVEGKDNSIVNVLVKDDSNSALAGADVFIFESGSANQVISGTTGDDGYFFAVFNESYAAGENFDVNVQKTDFDDVSSVLSVVPFGSPILPVDNLDCVDISVAESSEISVRGGSTDFSIVNNCDDDVRLNLSKMGASDIEVSIDGFYDLDASPDFTLVEGEDVDVRVNSLKQFGVHPIFVRGFLGDSDEEKLAGIARIVIFDASACLGVTSGGGSVSDPSFSFDLLDAREIFSIFNSCYTGLEGGIDEEYPRDNFSELLGESLIIEITDRIRDRNNESSEVSGRIFNKGLGENVFVLLEIEDFVVS